MILDCFLLLLRNLLPSIGERVRATKEETIIANVKEIAVSLKSVPEIPSIKINGKKTATNTSVVEIIAKVTLFEPLTEATKGLSPFSTLLYIASVIIMESSTTIPIAKIAARRTKIFIDKSKNHKPKAAEIRLTGRATAGTITAFRFPKNK